MSACCGKAIIKGAYQPLNQRLIAYGEEAYIDVVKKSRTLLWVFSFYDEKSACKACRSSFSDMYNWFRKYNLLEDPIRSVKIVVESEPEKNLIYTDLGIKKLPMHIFCDADGKIFDIIYDFPKEKWLETYILPYIQADGKPI